MRVEARVTDTSNTHHQNGSSGSLRLFFVAAIDWQSFAQGRTAAAIRETYIELG